MNAIQSALIALARLAPVFIGLTVAEMYLPCHGRKPSWQGRGRALVFWIVATLIGTLLAIPVVLVVAALHIHPLLASWTLPGPIGFIAGGMAAIVAGDLAYYWLHRFQHRFLWPLHAVHHSVRELSGVAGYHHVTELPIQALFWGVPVALIVPDPNAVPFFSGLAIMWGHFVHSPIAIRFGGLERILASNRFHRIHHSLEPEHWDRNFGVVFPWWDYLFGTAWKPAPEEWPSVGVDDRPEPQTVGAFVLAPLRKSAPEPQLGGVALKH